MNRSWRKSSYSGNNEGGSNCVEVGGWRKATASQMNGGCVEAGSGDGVVGVRDTKQNGEGPTLLFTPAAWSEFLASLR